MDDDAGREGLDGRPAIWRPEVRRCGEWHAGTPEATGIAAVGDAEPSGTTSAATGNEAGPQVDSTYRPRRTLRDARLLLVALRGEHAKDASGMFTTNTDFVAEKFYAVAAVPA